MKCIVRGSELLGWDFLSPAFFDGGVSYSIYIALKAENIWNVLLWIKRKESIHKQQGGLHLTALTCSKEPQ